MLDTTISTLIDGVDSSLSDGAKQKLEQSIMSLDADLQSAKFNRSTKSTLGKLKDPNAPNNSPQITDTEVYTNLSNMINGDSKMTASFGTVLENLYMKNKKYYSIIKDYELMPILIPQINRVLMFLVNECLSPDIQNEQTFTLKYTDTNDPKRIQDDITAIKKEMKLDNLLRDVYTNRFKLGREYYVVIDYNNTFNHMIDMIRKKNLNEGTGNKVSDVQFLDETFKSLTDTINETSCDITLSTIAESSTISKTGKNETTNDIKDRNISLSFDNLNIKIERSPVAKLIKEAHGKLIAENCNRYSLNSIFKNFDDNVSLNESINEAVIDNEKLEKIVTDMKKKKLQRCTIDRFDPARTFKLKIGGKVIAYMYITDVNGDNGSVVNFAQSLKDQLLKSRVTNMQIASQSAEEVISKDLAEKIVNKYDGNIGINRIEDIDLLHNFIMNNEVYKGNKCITFYYPDELFDLSRADDSILTNAVFFTKLYSTLLVNNIMTKVLRGRGRQIHTVKLGVSPSVRRYIENAMASLTMPENNLGSLHGSFEQILNPFNSSSDIIIPTEENDDRYITTDYIPGQDVDMNDEFLRTILNAIISSFGLDSAVIDVTNGNVQFARTLSMESLQISTLIRNEQQDLHDAWEQMCLRVLYIMGNDDTKNAIDDNKIKMTFFEPKSLLLQNSLDELNNAKSFAEGVADVIPQFNEDGAEMLRSMFVFSYVKDHTNIDWSKVEATINDGNVKNIDNQMMKEIREVIRKYHENTVQQNYSDQTDDLGSDTTDDDFGDDSEFLPGKGDEDLL